MIERPKRALQQVSYGSPDESPFSHKNLSPSPSWPMKRNEDNMRRGDGIEGVWVRRARQLAPAPSSHPSYLSFPFSSSPIRSDEDFLI